MEPTPQDPADLSDAPPMNGAESLVRTLVDAGVEVCFANPGTSEMHLVAALDRVDGMRPVLGLFEGVVTGMADGYGRIAGKPAVTLLHLGPGLANGIANLHNARRASTPIVNVVGDHATSHLQYDAPLTSDIVGLARTVSSWVHTTSSARTVAADAARAVQAARQAPGQIATLVLPADTAWSPAEHPAPALLVPSPATVTDDAVRATMRRLHNGRRTALLLRGAVLHERGLQAAGRIAAATGARLLCDTFTARLQRGAGRVAVQRLPYFAEQLVDALSDVEQLVLVGSKPPVSFFAYPGKPSWGPAAGTDITVLAHPHEDGVTALEAVADLLDAPDRPVGVVDLAVDDVAPTGRLDQFTMGRSIARHLPVDAIVADESATSGLGFAIAGATAAPHDVLSLTGGSIGQGLPVATGAAVAAGGRKVVCIHGDGGAMYTLQALWTQARERLDVVTVVCSNRAYSILQIELARVGAGQGGPKALAMFDLGNPDLDWVRLAEGMGVEAVRVDTAESFDDAFASAVAASGPRLVEAVL